ncbi:MAG: transcription termination/antitermination protein NusG [Polyangiaceae bacterium]
MTEPETNDLSAAPADAPAEGDAPAEAGAPSKKWYVVTTYSGYENKVKSALQERIRQFKMDDKFGEILIPSETVTEQAKDGKQRVKTKTSFPGYVFVEMEMSEHAWHIVKDTPKVTGFIGNQRPQEVKPPHIEDLRKGIVEGAVKPKPRHQFQEGDEVRVVVGAFANFSGTVQEVKPDKQKLQGHGQHFRASDARGAGFLTRGEEVSRAATRDL